MKDKKKSNATQWISFRVTASEYNNIQTQCKASAHTSMSEYARNILKQKPIVIKYRNESADAFIAEIISIKKELNSFGNNYNQAVKKLHSLAHHGDIQSWLFRQEKIQQQFITTVDTLLRKANQIYEQWSSV